VDSEGAMKDPVDLEVRGHVKGALANVFSVGKALHGNTLRLLRHIVVSIVGSLLLDPTA
jgi:hypothetical protein